MSTARAPLGEQERRSVAPLRGALLGLVARQPVSGYDLTKIFDHTLGNVWSARHSQIYPELAAMAADGLLDVEETGPRRRKEYSITPAGEAALRRWLVRRPPQARLSRNEALLRCFFLGFMPPDEAAAFLAAERARHVRQLDMYLADRDAGRADPPRGWTGGIALEAGIRYERMMIEWLDWAAAELERRDADGAS